MALLIVLFSLSIASVYTSTFGDLHIRLAVFYTPNFERRCVDVDLPSAVMAILKTVQLKYKTAVWKDTADITFSLVHLARLEAAYNYTDFNASKVLNDFISEARVLRIQNKGTWEVPILLMATNFYWDHDNKLGQDTTGLAHRKGLCAYRKVGGESGGIVEARQMRAALVVTHEIGHILSISHDGKKSSCHDDSFIMSPSIGPGKVTFSSCSVRQFAQELNDLKDDMTQDQFDKCLRDTSVPIVPGFDISKGPSPGEIMDPTAQCRFGWGSAYDVDFTKSSAKNNICNMMWCRHGFWSLKAHPALPGSVCLRTSDHVFRCNHIGECVEHFDYEKAIA